MGNEKIGGVGNLTVWAMEGVFGQIGEGREKRGAAEASQADHIFLGCSSAVVS